MTSKIRIKHLLELANEASNKDDAMNNITYKKKVRKILPISLIRNQNMKLI